MPYKLRKYFSCVILESISILCLNLTPTLPILYGKNIVLQKSIQGIIKLKEVLAYSVLGKVPPEKIFPGKLPSGKNSPRKIIPRKIAYRKNDPQKDWFTTIVPCILCDFHAFFPNKYSITSSYILNKIHAFCKKKIERISI